MSSIAHTWAEAVKRQPGPPRALYADPFDPITAWHLAVIDEAAPIFGELILLVTGAADHGALFQAEERAILARELTRSHRNVRVEVTSREVTEVARDRNVRYLIKALSEGEDPRLAADSARRDYLWAPDVTPIFVPLPQRVVAVGSEDLKALARRGARLSRFCHPRVARLLQERLKERLGDAP
ncbi:MAG: hypothetical protein RBU30_06245 [Polyangia bacterium]|jgi:pantetheine-phosphate adenylyltransferase|nr:hypothetical protein [Polyangia bacterium]